MLLFSDLHLSPSTLPTCMKILRFVHSEALRRKTTIGFLGDFFDRVYNEGTLPVDILNELMRFFSDEWHVPMIMIPGNHDYFDASETEHGLSPFKYASNFIQILDKPTMIGTQLWVPWRRDTDALKRTIESHANCDVIFGHFDIVGFKLNAVRVSTEGLSPSMFPTGTPVYTGHYHTPQVHGTIRYLGSPYQLSLSEAEDRKSLLVLDEHWHVCEEIPLDIGRKQYKWTASELISRSSVLRPADRVSVACSLTDSSITDLLADLKERGVNVQIRRLTSETTTRVEKQKDMSPLELLSAYAHRSDIDQLSNAWKRILDWLKKNPHEDKSMTTNPVMPMKLEISGLGPFKGPITLSMQGDGFTLVSGECNETRGSSNGAGKSIVTAGAWLWACTGQIDGRGPLAFDSETSVIHKGSEEASVSVSGLMDDVPWKIMRSLSFNGRQRKHHLRLFINHIERTRSTLRGTQRAIASELFGLDVSGSELHQWLLRNSVWSQQSVSRWLDANDSQAKQEIHALANMDNWQAMWSWCKLLVKDSKEALALATQAKTAAKTAADEATARYERALVMAKEWQDTQEERIAVVRREIDMVRQTYNDTSTPAQIEIDPENEREVKDIELQVEDTRMCIAKMKAHAERLERNIPTEWFKRDIEQEEEKLRHEKPPNIDQTEIRKGQCEAEKKAREIQLHNKRDELRSFQSKGECAACGRPFPKGEGHHNHLRMIQQQVDACRLHYRNANSVFVDAQQKHIHAKMSYQEYHDKTTHIQNVKSFTRVRAKLEEAQSTFKLLCLRLDMLKNRLEKKRQRKMIYDETRRLREELNRTIRISEQRLANLERINCPHDTSDTEKREADTRWQESVENVAAIRIGLDEAMAMQKWTGPRGIQTYAMENTVQRLAGVMTQWLRRFFHTGDIQMKVFFDQKERLQRYIDCPKHAGFMSGGQWRRAQLASFMAWREMSGAAIPLLILDEACTSMDADGIRSVQQTLRDWCDEDSTRTCFFISHEPEQHRDTSVYQHHIRIVHKRGRSYVVDESSSKKQRK